MAAFASRYARAFADVVMERKLEPARTVAQLRALVEVFAGNKALRHVWDNPAVPAEQKRAVLEAIVARMRAAPLLRNFVAVLIEHGRITSLPEIAQQFEHELNARLGLTEAEIITARELSPKERRELEVQAAKLTGKKILARYGLDSKLLGGAIVRVGSSIYDGSVRGQLQRLKQELSQ